MFANRMSTYNNPSYTCPFVDPSEWDGFRDAFALVRFVMNAIHELLGHGTGKLLSETSPGKYNFDKQNPPINPLTGKPVDSWYPLGETWPGLGGRLANTIEECRANLVAYFLADNWELLSLFGYDEDSTPTADDCKSSRRAPYSMLKKANTLTVIYYTYLFIAVEGVLALQFYEKDGQSWGQPHRRVSLEQGKYESEPKVNRTFLPRPPSPSSNTFSSMVAG